MLFLPFYPFTFLLLRGRFLFCFGENGFIAFQLLFGHDVRIILAKFINALLDAFHSRFCGWLILAGNVLDEGIGFCFVLGGCITGCLNFRTEAALLSGLACSSADETLLYAQQVKNTILTSVRTETGIGYLARLDGGIRLVLRPFVELTLHGAGDVFTSALCGELLCGKAPMDALDSAADFCDRCIQETVKRQPWHWYGLAFEPVLKGNHV